MSCNLFFTFSQENELSLSKAIELALEENYGIIISKSNVEIASRNNTWGNAGRFPILDFSSSATFSSSGNSNQSSLRTGIGLSWTLFNGFKVNVTKNKLNELEELSGGNSMVVIENTIQDIVLSYYNILLQREKLLVLEKVMMLSKDRYEYEELKRELGGTVTYNVLQAKNNFLSDKSSYLNQEVVVRNGIRNLNFLLGEETSRLWVITEEFQADTSDYIISNLLDKMLANNQQLQNQYTNLVLMKNEIELRKSTLYPRIGLSSDVFNNYNMTSGNSDLNFTNRLDLTYDIYTGGTRQLAIVVAKIQEEIEMVETEQMKHSLTNLLLNEYDLYNIRKTLLNVAIENLEAAELNLQIADEKFRTGAINSFNYRDIQLIYLNAALQKIQSVYNLIDSHTMLTRLTGGYINPQE
ncbi:TolC family protein [Bacteroidota bacterium]